MGGGGRRRFAVLVAAAVASTAPWTPDSVAAQSGDELDFFIGDWDVTSIDSVGTVVGRSRTSARWILDHTTIQDDWYGLDPTGTVVFRATSLRTFDPGSGSWIVHWAMANLPGYTYIVARWVDGELHGEGRGFDGGGDFVERYRYYDITSTSYSFALSRSYDDGATWAAYPELRARKR